MKKIIVVLMMSFAPMLFAQSGYFYDGTSLYQKGTQFLLVMNSEPHGTAEELATTAFLGYVQAIVDVLAYTKEIVIPVSTTAGQVGLIVMQYMTSHPKQWTGNAASVVTSAIMQAYSKPKRTSDKPSS